MVDLRTALSQVADAAWCQSATPAGQVRLPPLKPVKSTIMQNWDVP